MTDNLRNHMNIKRQQVKDVAKYLDNLVLWSNNVLQAEQNKKLYTSRLDMHTRLRANVAKHGNKSLDEKYKLSPDTDMGNSVIAWKNQADAMVDELGDITYYVLAYKIMCVVLYGVLCGMYEYCNNLPTKQNGLKKEFGEFNSALNRIRTQVYYITQSHADTNPFDNQLWNLRDKRDGLESCFPEKINGKLGVIDRFRHCSSYALDAAQIWFDGKDTAGWHDFIEQCMVELQPYCPPAALDLYYTYSISAMKNVLQQPQYVNLRQNKRDIDRRIAIVRGLLPAKLVRDAKPVSK